MTKEPEIVGAFTALIDAPGLNGRFWSAALRGIVFLGCVCGLMLLGMAVAQSLGLLFI